MGLGQCQSRGSDTIGQTQALEMTSLIHSDVPSRVVCLSPRPVRVKPVAVGAMSGVRTLNKNADVMGAKAALHMNIHAAGGLQDVMKTNLGPRGTIKMLVSGAGDIKLTKVRLCSASRGAETHHTGQPGLTCTHMHTRAGRQRAAPRDADPEPDGHHDRTHRCGAGRRHRVRPPLRLPSPGCARPCLCTHARRPMSRLRCREADVRLSPVSHHLSETAPPARCFS